MKQWSVGVAEAARVQLAAIKDTRIVKQISERIDKLQYDPDQQGKPLKDDLEDYRSIKVAEGRYRIIYTLKDEDAFVLVVTVGIRKDGDKKDAYNLARKLTKLDLLHFLDPNER